MKEVRFKSYRTVSNAGDALLAKKNSLRKKRTPTKHGNLFRCKINKRDIENVTAL